ncbi:pectate lyase [Candidatus Sumerlaeota bacterium]|nr:pectate lyase [Candidatus Sumerlaeota bacterium]
MRHRRFTPVALVTFLVLSAVPSPRARAQTSTLARRIQEIDDPAQRAAWNAYMKRDERQVRLIRETMVRELRDNGIESAVPAPPGESDFPTLEDRPAEWFRGVEALRIADNAISFQLPTGGWARGVEMTSRPRRPGERWFTHLRWAGTFDNGETDRQMRFLAQVATASDRPRFREACARGLDFVLNAQFPNGGWPRTYPLAGGTRDNIAFSDETMVRCLDLLRDASRGQEAFGFLNDESRLGAARAFEKGVQCLVQTQVSMYGAPTGWCRQYEPLTLEPAAGGPFEPACLATGETASVLGFLVSLDAPTSAAVRAAYGAAQWLGATRIDGFRWEMVQGAFQLLSDPKAQPIWARFYETGSNRPVFVGGDGILRYNVLEIDAESRDSHAWYEWDRQRRVLSEFPAWSQRHPRPF